jgi:hypothetical protein
MQGREWRFCFLSNPWPAADKCGCLTEKRHLYTILRPVIALYFVVHRQAQQRATMRAQRAGLPLVTALVALLCIVTRAEEHTASKVSAAELLSSLHGHRLQC